ncbi:MAG: ribonuclease III, partial [Caldimonas sp.]
MDSRLLVLQQRIGHRFADPGLLQRALTHRSYGTDHNERLEFLGDAVLSLVVSSLLFDRFGDSDEGDLTRVRAHLVREDSLHRAALQLGLPELLRLGEGEARGGGALRASILADALEAMIGAVYLDGGLPAARQLVLRLLAERIDRLPQGPDPTVDPAVHDYKSRLQELVAREEGLVPEYVCDESGPEHE